MDQTQRRLSAAAIALACGTASAQVGLAPLAPPRADALDLSRSPNALIAAERPAPVALRRGALRLNGPMTRARQAALSAAGIRVTRGITPGVLEADLAEADLDAVARLGFVDWAGEIPLAARVSDAVVAGDFARVDAGQVELHALLAPSADTAAAIRAIERVPGAEVLSAAYEAGGVRLAVTAPADQAINIARAAHVRWVEEAPALAPRETDAPGSMTSSRWMVQSNDPTDTPLYDAGITGTGVIAGVIDDGLTPVHCSLIDDDFFQPFGSGHRKIQAYNDDPVLLPHGTAVSALLVGDSGVDDDTRGVAYGARMTFSLIPEFTTAALTELFLLHEAQGATVHNNSWGDDLREDYGALPVAVDTFTWENDEHLVVFAITNIERKLKTPENAKNGLAVGAVGGTPSDVNGTCSVGGEGPTADGRRKPDLVAPGCAIVVADSSVGQCGLSRRTGTSFSAPAVSGAAALATEYFRRGFYPSGSETAEDGFEPLGTTLKALLVNSTIDITGLPGNPADREGYGRPLLANALPFEGDRFGLVLHQQANNKAGALATGEVFETTFESTTGEGFIRATLAFYDAPGAPGSTSPVVNDLDLELISPSGVVFSNADAINTVEQVTVGGAQAGLWTARVRAANVAVGTQGFGLVIRGDAFIADEPCSPADVAEPFGQIDLADVQTFMTDFQSDSPAADLVAPFGTLDLSDVQTFLFSFAAGCP